VLRDVRRRGNDDGAALVVVVGSMLVLALLAVTALGYTLSSQRFARYDQDYAGSMAAAQAGVDDFIARLNRNPAYGDAIDCTNAAWRGPTSDTNSCGYSASTQAGWLPVTPGETGTDAAWFHVSVQNMAANKNRNVVDLVVTGRVRDVTRTIQATVGKGGSTDYVYYTDRESADPLNTQAYPSGAPHAYCGSGDGSGARYWWNGRSGLSGTQRCQEIQFGGDDVLRGAVFSNDSILSVGGEFAGTLQTANPGCKAVTAVTSTWTSACLRAGSSGTTFSSQPSYADLLQLDDTSAQFATFPGCHYTGSTRVVLRADGRMTVWNKKSINGMTAPVATAAANGVTPVCGTLDALDSAAGATVAVPDGMVLYVGNSTGVAARQCLAGELGGPTGQELPLGTYTAEKLAGPASSSDRYTVDTNMIDELKYCAKGNLYVEGVLSGSLTAAAAASIVVTGDLVMKNGIAASSTDMLGLVATNSVEVFHPRLGTVSATKVTPSCSRSCAYKWGAVGSATAEVAGWPRRYADPTESRNVPTKGLQIAASIQTLQHSFFVQQYAEGPQQGDLLVRGSIAQRWRGIVAKEGASGYVKDYRYDDRLQSRWPPYFPKWVNAKFDLRVSGEIDTPAAVRSSTP